MTIRICRLKTPPVLVLLSLAAAPPCVTAEDKIVLNDDGGWCWFQDERAIVDSHRVIVGSVASGVTDATRRGSVEVTTWDTVTGGRVTVPLHPGLALDDHNAPALLVRSGGRSLAGVSEPARASSPARVACIGDSITYGAKVVDRGHNAYPAQLQPRLGAGYEVRNFGVGGRTLLQAADTPYVATDAWRNVVAWAPDVAVVMLGTNDTCQSDRRRNWEHADELAASTRSLIDGLRAANPRVRVLLVRPPPMFPGQPGLAEPRRLDLAERDPRLAVIGHTLAAVAATIDGVEYHDLDRVLEVRHVVDGVHPNAFGA
ncbi:MAG: hypothetical protein KJO43_02665, partial [Phycisphaerae bacterium]|nr:hypothetical protein [Phycisphaerae bacterium]